MGILLPALASGRRHRRAGFGAVSVLEGAAGSDSLLADIAPIVFAAKNNIRSAKEFANRAHSSQTPQDLSGIATVAEEERDASRAASRKYAASLSGTAVSIGLYLSTTGYGAVVGLAVAGVAVAAYLVYEGVLWFIDGIEHDADAEEYQQRAADEIRWHSERGFPFPRFVRGRYGNVQTYADVLSANRESIEYMPPEDLRAALFAVGKSFLACMDDEVIIQAAFVIGGEGGRSWPHVGYLSDQVRDNGSNLVSDYDAIQLLIAAVGVATAREYDLPATHVQACIDAASDGWSSGATRARDSSYEHSGAVALGTARIWSESMAQQLRASLDAAEAAQPGAVAAVFGSQYTSGPRLSDAMAGRIAGLRVTIGKYATTPPDPVGAGAVDPRVADAMKPPPPAEKPPEPLSAPAKVAIAGGVLAAVGLVVAQTTAGEGVRLFFRRMFR